MKRVLITVAIVATITSIVLGMMLKHRSLECQRLESNHRALLTDIEVYKSRSDKAVASAEILELEISELRRLRKEDARQIRSLGIRLRHAESYSQSVTTTNISMSAPIDSTNRFEHSDENRSISGHIADDSIHIDLEQHDTLFQVVHRVPRQFLFIKFGTKAIRQDVWSSNPNTKVIFTEYIELRDIKRGERRASRVKKRDK